MAKKSNATETTVEQPAGMRRCIGSRRYGIEPHDAPLEAFPRQPSQKDGLGRMCKTHWNAYTAGLARDAKARKAAVQPVDGAATGESVAAGNEGQEAAEPRSKWRRVASTPQGNRYAEEADSAPDADHEVAAG